MRGSQALRWADRTWDRLSHIGIEGHDRVVARYIMGTNHFVVLAMCVSIAWTVAFCIALPPSQWLPAGSHALLMAVWVGCLVLNRVGRHLAASFIAILAPLVQYVFLAWLFSADAGFQIALIALGGIAFAVLPPRLSWARVGYAVLALTGALVCHLSPAFDAPRLGVNGADIEVALAGNMVAAALLVVLLAAFSDHYLVRERRLAEALVDQAERAAKTDALTGVLNRRGLAPHRRPRLQRRRHHRPRHALRGARPCPAGHEQGGRAAHRGPPAVRGQGLGPQLRPRHDRAGDAPFRLGAARSRPSTMLG